jgi:hypothetical protein
LVEISQSTYKPCVLFSNIKMDKLKLSRLNTDPPREKQAAAGILLELETNS